MVYKNMTELIGRTPLLELVNLEKTERLGSKLIAKLEYFNPTGSVKDRIAFAMINDAEQKGLLKPGSVIIEPTSGNTGIGLAGIAAAKGYKVILVMPETMSLERRNLLKAYGAQLVLTEGSGGMAGAIKKAEQLKQEMSGAVILGQFTNPANPKVHFETTGREIWEDTNGEIDIFVAGVGTGGTISGAGEYLRSKKSDIRIVAVEPEASPVLSEGRKGAHKIQGIGAGFVPDTLNTDIYNEVIKVSDENAMNTAAILAKREGVLVGASSGAAAWAAMKLARMDENKEKTIVAVLPDTGERYLSTSMFDKGIIPLTW